MVFKVWDKCRIWISSGVAAISNMICTCICKQQTFAMNNHGELSVSTVKIAFNAIMGQVYACLLAFVVEPIMKCMCNTVDIARYSNIGEAIGKMAQWTSKRRRENAG